VITSRPAFRSYNPKDEQLQETARPLPLPVNIEEEISDTLEQGQVNTLLEDVVGIISLQNYE